MIVLAKRAELDEERGKSPDTTPSIDEERKSKLYIARVKRLGDAKSLNGSKNLPQSVDVRTTSSMREVARPWL